MYTYLRTFYNHSFRVPYNLWSGAYCAAYICSMVSAYFCAMTLRLALSVGPNSPVGTEKSCGSSVNFCTFCAFDVDNLLDRLMAASMAPRIYIFIVRR